MSWSYSIFENFMYKVRAKLVFMINEKYFWSNNGGIQVKLDSTLALKILIERNRRIAGYKPDYAVKNGKQSERGVCQKREINSNKEMKK
ncbi:hypothetical protein EXIGUO8A_590050 [Exiguobacterium sp. 8A]|nr:hypothetical protein EXIGUO8A_590050 [Exiguobacterium sp. 8A]